MKKKIAVSIVVIVVLALVMGAVIFGHNLYEMMLRVHGMGQ